jgi:protein O-mannosyl-transferase
VIFSDFLLYFLGQTVYQLQMFRPRPVGMALALVTLLVYLPATSCLFINLDDPRYVTANPIVQNGLTWTGVKWAFTGMHVSNWHPLTWLSHMADCDLFRLNPAGPHLVNILFHSVNAGLLFALLFRLTNKLWPCAFVAALFAWHPLHVESVAWIAERKDVLSTFFALLTLSSYARYAQENHRRSFWLALFFYVLALLSKPMPVTLPVVMLLLDYWPLNRVEGYKLKVADAVNSKPSTFNFRLSTLLEKWPFFLLAAASCVITFLAQRDTAVSSLTQVPFGYRLENSVTAYAAYLWKMVWPMDLSVFYPLHPLIAWQLVAESAIILSGISVIVWRVRKGSPWLIVGWLWYLVTLLPVIGLVQVGTQAMADRYSYFPLIGIFLAVAFSAQALADRFIFLKRWLAVAAVLMLGSCLMLTEVHLRYWHDSETLFTHALEVETSQTAHINLGVAFYEQKRRSEALKQYIMAFELYPAGSDTILAYCNAAALLDEAGKLDAAAACYQKAVQLKPRNPDVYDNFGIVLVKLGRFDEAMKAFSAAAQIDATDAHPHFLMGRLMLQQGRDADALMQLHLALQLDPHDLEILLFTIGVLAADENQEVRNGAEAQVLADRAVKLTAGQEPAVLDVQAMALAETGQFDAAVRIQQQAIKLLAATADQKDDIAVMQKHLELYQKQQPWRESFNQTLKASLP